MDTSTWLSVIGMAGAASATVVGAAWSLLIQPKHAQISRLWDEVRRREAEVKDLELRFTKDYVTRDALARVEQGFKEAIKELGGKIDALHNFLLEERGR